ncbi:hypothetical protein SteCoe_11005 [Stentor coeruleus]|uniref:Protein kinase domain-containing protein n=1 Tax=Stentor coeruleus TaxID=5963 RepID=A0A1R2CE87_9CILI|nr:hypothetical protein SteCoe_11005 [Stentor coeruleus]
MGCAAVKNRQDKSKDIHSINIKKDQLPSSIIDSIGMTFHPDYVSLSVLKVGTLAEIIRVKHIPTKTYRALRVIPKHRLIKGNIDPNTFSIQATLHSKLSHPNIIEYIEHFSDEKYFFIVTELCKGFSLLRKSKQVEKFSEIEASNTMYEILQAVEYMHNNNIVHRDLSLENVQIKDFTCNTIKIAGFDYLSELGPDGKTQGVYGSLHFIAPEVFRGKYNEKVDIWSCGIIAYILITGKYPYIGFHKIEQVGKMPFELTDEKCAGFSGELKNLMKKMLDMNPESRISASDALKHWWFKKNISKHRKSQTNF